MGALTKQEIDVLIIIERTTAAISVTGTLILLGTFIFIKEFRTLSNTLIFYASFANLFASVAVLIGGSALSHVNGALCQFQGFLLEMFMQSDPLWSCAMAVNVYLVFFRRYDAHRLKKLYWVYCLLCYGLPFIPALFCLVYKTKVKGKMYGNATVRTPTTEFYVLSKRSQLRALSGGGTLTSTSHPDPEPASPSPFTGLRTTEIEVVTTATKSPIETPPESYTRPEKPAAGGRDQYTITISAHDSRPTPPPPTPRGLFPRRPSSMDKVKWAYTKCAMLFAISILITWVPASANRVYGLRYPKSPSFALNICSAIVLPLQGFWNTVIYFTTSLSICRGVFARLRSRGQGNGARPRGSVSLSGFTVLEERERGKGKRGQRKEETGSESTIELSLSRSLGSLSESV
ncbi:Cyclic AMP receptor-like protein A [Lachnellula arida]|uniref:Cyclic AMP receptor-like protein A n=1 Tax=Lachnellula arida TaxID=1316785 RepID=A0A8T9BS84_9HELO|nr:Cyclic AMP receptor-like protein A [Lachnellula arida]